MKFTALFLCVFFITPCIDDLTAAQCPEAYAREREQIQFYVALYTEQTEKIPFKPNRLQQKALNEIQQTKVPIPSSWHRRAKVILADTLVYMPLPLIDHIVSYLIPGVMIIAYHNESDRSYQLNVDSRFTNPPFTVFSAMPYTKKQLFSATQYYLFGKLNFNALHKVDDSVLQAIAYITDMSPETLYERIHVANEDPPVLRDPTLVHTAINTRSLRYLTALLESDASLVRCSDGNYDRIKKQSTGMVAPGLELSDFAVGVTALYKYLKPLVKKGRALTSTTEDFLEAYEKSGAFITDLLQKAVPGETEVLFQKKYPLDINSVS